jgi:hypothetical protein
LQFITSLWMTGRTYNDLLLVSRGWTRDGGGETAFPIFTKLLTLRRPILETLHLPSKA